MSLVRLLNITKRYEDRMVLREVSLRLAAGDRIGLVGKNGTGKTTILRLILGQEEPQEGIAEINPGVRLGYFSQFSDLNADDSIQRILEGLFSRIRAMEDELTGIGERLEAEADAGRMEALLDRQAHLLDEMTHLDGWEYPRHIDTVLTKLGFNETRRSQPVSELSGGWRNRASLAKILLEEPDVLLLDEPTNYLDVAGVAWLEEWVRGFRGALLVVSHDRQFLDSVVTRIVEIENYHLHDYPGGYTDYIRKKPFRVKNMERQFEHEEELLALESEAASDRQELARNPSDATRRKLADIKKRRPPRPVDLIVTDIYQGLSISDRLLSVEGLSKSYGGHHLFDGVRFELERGERLGIVGPNGIGKSTLMRILTGHEKPDAGKVSWEGGTSFADFNAIERDLDRGDTITHAVNVFGLGYGATRKQVNRFLSLLQFSELDLGQKIGTLSGGQRARVALAKCLLSGSPVLILDEPTNHLDLASAQVMEQALVHFPGAVITVSHDRFFLDKVATRLLVFGQDHAPRAFNGNWSMWQASEGRVAAG
jgi:ATP-binding cassette subfamily F protein 3